MKELLPNQIRFTEIFDNLAEDGQTLFFLSGTSGCGKTFAMNRRIEQFEQSGITPIVFQGDSVFTNCEYWPYLKSLSSILPLRSAFTYSQHIIDVGENLTGVGKTISSILKIFDKRDIAQRQIRDLILTETEQEIVCKMQYLAEHNDILFFCDNINYWDEKSLRLLYILLDHIDSKYEFFQNVFFVISYTSDVASDNLDLIKKIKEISGMNYIDFPVLQKTDYESAMLSLNYKIKLSPKDYSTLASLVNGHIRMLIELTSELKQNNLTLSSVTGKSGSVLVSILKKRLDSFGDVGELIKTTLEYASLLGISFSAHELYMISSSSEFTFKQILEYSNDMNLIEENGQRQYILQFVHDTIHSIFCLEASKNSKNYHEKIELCLKQMVPDQYIRRYQYAYKAMHKETAFQLLVLDIIKHLRCENKISTQAMEKCAISLKDKPDYLNFIKEMEKAYQLYQKGFYKESLNFCQSLNDIYPIVFRIEKEILCSLCYSKEIDPAYRMEGIHRLSRYKTLEKCDNEIDLYERVHLRLLIMYVHVGDKENGLREEGIIIESLHERMNHDFSAQTRYHILERISNALYNCEVSLNKMKNSLAYFQKDFNEGGLWHDLKQYFISGVNYAGALCLNGKFKESFIQCDAMRKLGDTFLTYPFPRINILINNWLISGYLSGALDTQYCQQIYSDFIKPIPKCAERLLYKSNHAIFMALSGKPKEALEYIKEEEKLHAVIFDKEGIYNYRIIVNSAVFTYLSGNKTKAINMLTSLVLQMQQSLLSGDDLYDRERAIKLVNYMKLSDTIVNPKEWENILTNKNRQQTSWDYYGKGFVFTTTFNWDI